MAFTIKKNRIKKKHYIEVIRKSIKIYANKKFAYGRIFSLTVCGYKQ